LTRPYLIWVAQLRFTQIPQESTRQDYLHEVEHMRERVARLEQAIMEAVKLASQPRYLRYHCERVGPGISLRERSPAYKLLRRCTERGFQW
jgi:hypothetical protein